MKFVWENVVGAFSRSPPSRGAWIEILWAAVRSEQMPSPPSRGAWIEIARPGCGRLFPRRRPPRGGRGLKYRLKCKKGRAPVVAPLAGGVD